MDVQEDDHKNGLEDLVFKLFPVGEFHEELHRWELVEKRKGFVEEALELGGDGYSPSGSRRLSFQSMSEYGKRVCNASPGVSSSAGSSCRYKRRPRLALSPF